MVTKTDAGQDPTEEDQQHSQRILQQLEDEEDRFDDPIWEDPHDDGEFEQPEPPENDLIHEW